MYLKTAMLGLCLCGLATSGLTCPSDCEEGQPNPAVDEIEFTLVSQTSDTQGIVEIEGVVENKGTGTFDSTPGQQSVQLYQDSMLLAEEEFEDLAPGARVEVSHEMMWTTGSEFPPTFRVVIAYDPDIYMDGNPLNDDCANVDNALQRSGAEIDALFP